MRRTRTPSKEKMVVGSRSWSKLVCGTILMGTGSGDGVEAGGNDWGQPRVSLNWSRRNSKRGLSNDILVRNGKWMFVSDTKRRK